MVGVGVGETKGGQGVEVRVRVAGWGVRVGSVAVWGVGDMRRAGVQACGHYLLFQGKGMGERCRRIG